MLLLAYRDYDTEQDWEDEEALASNLTVLAFVGIQVRFLNEYAMACFMLNIVSLSSTC